MISVWTTMLANLARAESSVNRIAPFIIEGRVGLASNHSESEAAILTGLRRKWVSPESRTTSVST